MLNLLIDTTDPKQDGILDAFLSPGKGIARDFVRADAVLGFIHRPVVPSITNIRSWDDDHLSTDTYQIAIGNVDTPPVGGTWLLTVGATAVGAQQYNVTAASLQTSLSAASTTAGYGNVTVVLLSVGFYQVTWNNNGAVPVMTSGSNTLSPSSTVSILQLSAGSGSTQAQQLIALRQAPVAFSEPTTQLPDAAVTAVVEQAGDATHNKRYSLTLTPGTYGGTFALTVTAATGAAQGLGTISGTVTAQDFATLLATQSVIDSTDNVSVTRVGDVLNVEFIGTQALSDVPVIDVVNVDLLAPKGVSGTINLNTYNLYLAFAETTADELTFTFAIRRSRATGEEAEYFIHDVILKRNLLDPTSFAPLNLPTYYTKAEADALFEKLANKGVANGYAPLNSSGKVPNSYLPSGITGVTDPNVAHVQSDGDDSTGDGSPGSPFLTAQKAYDLGTFEAWRLGAGSYSVTLVADMAAPVAVLGVGRSYTTLTVTADGASGVDGSTGSAGSNGSNGTSGANGYVVKVETDKTLNLIISSNGGAGGKGGAGGAAATFSTPGGNAGTSGASGNGGAVTVKHGVATITNNGGAGANGGDGGTGGAGDGSNAGSAGGNAGAATNGGTAGLTTIADCDAVLTSNGGAAATAGAPGAGGSDGGAGAGAAGATGANSAAGSNSIPVIVGSIVAGTFIA